MNVPIRDNYGLWIVWEVLQLLELLDLVVFTLNVVQEAMVLLNGEDRKPTH